MMQGVQTKSYERLAQSPAPLLLASMMVLGFALRLFNLDATGLWMDELHSVIGSDPGKTVSQVIEYCKQDQPPLFFLMLHGWFKIFPYEDFSGQALVAITGSLGIIAIYFAGKEWKNINVGLIAAFLATINYFHVDASRQIRFYPLVFLLSTLSFLFFLRIFKRRKTTDFILYAIFTSALLNTHYFGLVVFASQFLIFLTIIFWKGTDVRFVISSLAAGVIVGLSFLHWIPVVISDLGISEFHAQKLDWYFPARFHWVYFRDIVTALVCAVLAFLAIRDFWFSFIRKQTTQEQIVLAGWLAFGFGIPLVYSLLRMPMLEYKYTFITLPAVFLLMAMGLDSLQSKKVKLTVVAVLFISFHVNALFLKPIYLAKPTEQWREVAKAALETDGEDQVVFTRYAWYHRYYFKMYGSAHQPLEPQFADFEAWLDTSDKVWVLVSTRFNDPGLSDSQQKLLEKNFRLVKELTFTDTQAKYYIHQ
jgi:4-amino-4-deoxy-L-arabinose transferase-like glycosyltransferase